MIEVAKISSQGQVTIPLEVRKARGVKSGDKLAFVSCEGGFLLMNASLIGLANAQKAFEGAAEKVGVSNEEDLLLVVKQSR